MCVYTKCSGKILRIQNLRIHTSSISEVCLPNLSESRKAEKQNASKDKMFRTFGTREATKQIWKIQKIGLLEVKCEKKQPKKKGIQCFGTVAGEMWKYHKYPNIGVFVVFVFLVFLLFGFFHISPPRVPKYWSFWCFCCLLGAFGFLVVSTYHLQESENIGVAGCFVGFCVSFHISLPRVRKCCFLVLVKAQYKPTLKKNTRKAHSHESPFCVKVCT